jgi:hypothetical protein
MPGTYQCGTKGKSRTTPAMVQNSQDLPRNVENSG